MSTDFIPVMDRGRMASESKGLGKPTKDASQGLTHTGEDREGSFHSAFLDAAAQHKTNTHGEAGQERTTGTQADDAESEKAKQGGKSEREALPLKREADSASKKSAETANTGDSDKVVTLPVKRSGKRETVAALGSAGAGEKQNGGNEKAGRGQASPGSKETKGSPVSNPLKRNITSGMTHGVPFHETATDAKSTGTHSGKGGGAQAEGTEAPGKGRLPMKETADPKASHLKAEASGKAATLNAEKAASTDKGRVPGKAGMPKGDGAVSADKGKGALRPNGEAADPKASKHLKAEASGKAATLNAEKAASTDKGRVPGKAGNSPTGRPINEAMDTAGKRASGSVTDPKTDLKDGAPRVHKASDKKGVSPLQKMASDAESKRMTQAQRQHVSEATSNRTASEGLKSKNLDEAVKAHRPGGPSPEETVKAGHVKGPHAEKPMPGLHPNKGARHFAKTGVSAKAGGHEDTKRASENGKKAQGAWERSTAPEAKGAVPPSPSRKTVDRGPRDRQTLQKDSAAGVGQDRKENEAHSVRLAGKAAQPGHEHGFDRGGHRSESHSSDSLPGAHTTTDTTSSPKLSGTNARFGQGEMVKQTFRENGFKHLVDKASLHLKNGQQQFKIELKPEFLGQVKVHVSTEHHQVTVKIMTKLPVTKELIEGSLQQLRTELQGQGLQVDKVNVSLFQNSNKNSGSARFTDPRKARKGRGRHQDSDDMSVASRVAKNDWTRTPATSSGALNLFA